jgi:hypothetical protein
MGKDVPYEGKNIAGPSASGNNYYAMLVNKSTKSIRVFPDWAMRASPVKTVNQSTREGRKT